MKRFVSYLALIIAGVACTIAAFFCQFYYTQYRHATDLDNQMSSFNMRLANLESRKVYGLTTLHVSGVISTTDQAVDEGIQNYTTDQRPPHFRITSGKAGDFVVPEFRLPAKASDVYEFDISVDNQSYGEITGVWLSHTAPYYHLASFDEFRVYPSKTNMIRLVVKLKPDASVKMHFNLVLLTQQGATYAHH